MVLRMVRTVHIAVTSYLQRQQDPRITNLTHHANHHRSPEKVVTHFLPCSVNQSYLAVPNPIIHRGVGSLFLWTCSHTRTTTTLHWLWQMDGT